MANGNENESIVPGGPQGQAVWTPEGWKTVEEVDAAGAFPSSNAPESESGDESKSKAAKTSK